MCYFINNYFKFSNMVQKVNFNQKYIAVLFFFLGNCGYIEPVNRSDKERNNWFNFK